jgi:hypothetical protein
MLCPAFKPQVTVGFETPGDAMPRRIDHLVICVRDLAQAELNLRTLGFTLTPTGVHPFGTSFRLAMSGTTEANRAIRRKMLQGHEPASTVIIAETVDGKWLLEIEAIAAE